MEKIERFKFGFIIFTLVLLTAALACDTSGLQDSIDNFGLVIGLDEINTGATVLVTDAVTGELINAKISVTFDGQNGSDVIDMYSDPVSEDEISSGILNFAIANSVVPTTANPAIVKLHMQAPGYASTTKTVKLTDVGFDDFSFTMLSNSNKPASIKTTAKTGSTAADGSLNTELNVSSNTGQSGEDSTGVVIPAGTVFTDANGNKLTGKLKVEMTNYDLTDPTATQNLPIAIEDLTEEGEPVPTVLGMVMLNITDEQGNVAASGSFSGGNAKMLPQDSVLTFSFEGLNIPSIISAWSYSCVKVEPDPITTAIKRGRSWLLFTPGYVCGVVVTTTDNLKTYTNLVIEGNGYEGTLKFNAISFGRSVTGSFPISTSPIASNIVFNKNSDAFVLEIHSPVETKINYPTLPEGDTFTITLPQKPTNLINSKVDVTLRCPNPSEKVGVTNIPQASVVFRKAGSTDKWRVISNVKWNFDEVSRTLTGGTFDITAVEQGVDYNFKLTYDGNVESKIINMSGANVSTVISEEIGGICS